MLTIIIPIDLHFRANDIIKKCKILLDKAAKENINFVFGHNNRKTNADKKFIELVKKYNNSKISSDTFYSGAVNTSKLRNQAAKLVSTEHICLLDIDIWPDIKLLKKYSERLKNNEESFYILPCLYLTKLGSNVLLKGKISKIELIERFFSYSRKEFLHLASPSSITIMATKDYIKLKGFDEKYNGHGYEDFDFLTRLSLLHDKIEIKNDFIFNNKCRSPLFVIGFRRYIGELCLKALLDKDIALHLYHKKTDIFLYTESRKNNYNLFTTKYSCTEIPPETSENTLIPSFIKLCSKYHYNLADYSILFDNKPGHIDRFDTLKRRIRFLING